MLISTVVNGKNGNSITGINANVAKNITIIKLNSVYIT
uniref:Uncharacterized protein n=1 Tax=viral metagenome TaxID=1070528 RepID=A0A6C0I658_9ZZZZ